MLLTAVAAVGVPEGEAVNISMSSGLDQSCSSPSVHPHLKGTKEGQVTLAVSIHQGPSVRIVALNVGWNCVEEPLSHVVKNTCSNHDVLRQAEVDSHLPEDRKPLLQSTIYVLGADGSECIQRCVKLPLHLVCWILKMFHDLERYRVG